MSPAATDAHRSAHRPPLYRSADPLIAALAQNNTLTELSLRDAEYGGQGGPAETLAQALRANSTLRTLDIGHITHTGTNAGFGGFAGGAGGGGLRLVLGALARSSSAGPSLCGVTSLILSGNQLDLPACEALGGSLARGAALECLDLEGCSARREGAAAIAEGLIIAAREGTRPPRSTRP